MIDLRYSRWYLLGWIPLLTLFALPIVEYSDVPGWAVTGVCLLIGLGWLCVLSAQGSKPSAPLREQVSCASSTLFSTCFFFSAISIIGSLLQARQQAQFLGDASFDSLQERYIALTEASLQGEATSSVWSTLGNLMGSFLFVGISSFVVYSKTGKSAPGKFFLLAMVGAALTENFLSSVSRVHLVFYLITGLATALLIDHPLMRRRGLIAASAIVIGVFLVITTGDRFDAKFADDGAAAAYIAPFFGVDILPLGQSLIDRAGLAIFTLSVYVIQGIPELVRLIAYNASPYAMGSHSLFLILAPLKLIGVDMAPVGAAPLSNQGFWWGLMGDLYIDFGVLFPISYLIALIAMVRAAKHYGSGPIYGVTLRTMTASMLVAIPYMGVFNTYCVSYFGILFLAMRERRKFHSHCAVPVVTVTAA